MKHINCGDCNCFKKQYYIKENNKPRWRGVCTCHGYHLFADDSICVDFER